MTKIQDELSDKIKVLIQAKYIEYVQNDDFGHLEKLQEITGISPELSENFVHEKYNAYIHSDIRGKHVFDIERLMKITSIKPEFSQDDIKTAYKALIIKDLTSHLKTLQEITGVGLAEEIVQEGYGAIICNGDLNNIPHLEKFTGIKPVFSEENIQNEYSNLVGKLHLTQEHRYLIKHIGGETEWVSKYSNEYLDRWQQIQQITEIYPSDQIIQDGFKNIASTLLWDKADEIGWESFKGITGGKASIETIYEIYGQMIREGHLHAFKSFQNFIGIKPIISEISEDDIQKGYESLILKIHSGEIQNYLKELESITGVKPLSLEKSIQQKYISLLYDGNPNEIEKFKEIFGVEPNYTTEDIQKAYLHLANLALNESYRYIENDENLTGVYYLQIEDLIEYTGIKPELPKDVIEGTYINFANQGFNRNNWDFSKSYGHKNMAILSDTLYLIQTLKEITEIKPDFSNNIVQEVYECLVKQIDSCETSFRCENEINMLERIEQVTGITPPKQIIQDMYFAIMKKNDVYALEKLHKVSGIKPSLKTYENFILSL